MRSNAPIRCLVYSHAFWPNVGGVELYARLLAEGLASDPAFSTVIATNTPNTGDELPVEAAIHRQPSLAALWQLVRSADIVFLAGPSIVPMTMAKLAGKPYVIEHHGYQAVCPNGLLLNKARGGVCGQAFRQGQYAECVRCVKNDQNWWRGVAQLVLTSFRRWLSAGASVNIGVTDHVCQRHSLPRMRVIYHGIPEPGTLCQLRLDPKQAVHFAYVGRLVEEKGLPLLLEAAVVLRALGVPFQVSFIGDGPLRPMLEQFVQKNGLEECIRFTGFLSGPALAATGAAVDVVVMPSVWEETAGLAAMEHMMRGGVVLAARIGGLSEVVGDGGVQFRPFDAEDLARKMQQLTDASLRETVGRAGRTRAMEMFQLERMVDDHKQLFIQVCGQN